jgi:hypothetical protein
VADQEKESGVITVAEGRDTSPHDGKPDRERNRDAIKEVRESDLEPYTGLRYLSKLFRFMAVILVMLLIAEIITGFYTQGSTAIPTLLGEASRLIVLAGVLWGTGDLAHLLIDVGHDVRAARILVGRVALAAKVAPAGMISGRARTDDRFTDREVTRADLGIGQPSGDGGEPPTP